MVKTTVQELTEIGQSIWLDYISRSLIDTGKLNHMIELGVRGLTSNPSIFDKAISTSNDYDNNIKELQRLEKSTFEIYDDLTVKDIQDAADIFRPIYEESHGTDGYVSLEINPELAYMVGETVAEGKRLFHKVNRPNVLFKVPSTDQGFLAMEELLAQGINVNVTLIFSLQQYINTAQSYIKGVKRFAQNKGDISRLSSVASVFVSRVDTQIDRFLDEKINQSPENIRKGLDALKGKAAVANAGIISVNTKRYFQTRSSKKSKKRVHVFNVFYGAQRALRTLIILT
jgi:transaldolase